MTGRFPPALFALATAIALRVLCHCQAVLQTRRRCLRYLQLVRSMFVAYKQCQGDMTWMYIFQR